MSDSARPTPGELLAMLTPEELPRVADFLAGYLHEDWTVDYDSPSEAAYDYLREADLNDVQELAVEWGALADAAHALPLDEVQRVLRERFRSAWQVRSVEEIDGVQAELENALRE